MSLKQALTATWKLCLSFRKHDWELADYPILIRKQSAPDPERLSARRVWRPYLARIVNWWVVTGSGTTPQQAMQDLTRQFVEMKENRRREGKPMPRPGTKVEIEFATSTQVHAHPDLTNDFIRRVLGVDWAFVSDQSSLWDFHAGETNDVFIGKIKDAYGVDVSDIETGNLAMILDRIAANRDR